MSSPENWNRRQFLKALGFGTAKILGLIPEFKFEGARDYEIEPKGKFEIVVVPELHTPLYTKTADNYQILRVRPEDEIEPGAVFRTQPEGNGILKIHKDNGGVGGWESYTPKDLYLREKDCFIIPPCTPLNVHPDTKPEDKQVIAFFNGWYPYAVLLEGKEVIAKVPIFLGGTPTEPKTIPDDYLANSVTVSRYMHWPGLWNHRGVPFVIFYSRGDGRAMHGSPWRAKYWDAFGTTPKAGGGWGSAGCINFPCFTRHCVFNIQMGGIHIGFDNFLFRWTMTNIKFDPYNEETAEVSSQDKNWYTGKSSLRVIATHSPKTLARTYPTSHSETATLTSWSPVVDQIKALEGSWMIPNFESDAASFITWKQPTS